MGEVKSQHTEEGGHYLFGVMREERLVLPCCRYAFFDRKGGYDPKERKLFATSMRAIALREVPVGWGEKNVVFIFFGKT